MARVLLVILLLLIAVFVGISVYYGSPDPCRMLATEIARDEARIREEEFGIRWDGFDDFREAWLRAEAAQLDTGECTMLLFDEWGANFNELISGDDRPRR